jgi:hypothetical protein
MNLPRIKEVFGRVFHKSGATMTQQEVVRWNKCADIPRPTSFRDTANMVFYHENIGKKRTVYDCFYCGLHDGMVECAGLFHCPNPGCTGPGGAWFRADLQSYKTVAGDKHTVDDQEWLEAAEAYTKYLWWKTNYKAAYERDVNIFIVNKKMRESGVI